MDIKYFVLTFQFEKERHDNDISLKIYNISMIIDSLII